MRIAAIVILALLVGIAARATRASTSQGRYELFEIRVDGKGRRALITGPNAVIPVSDVSRDGSRILFLDGDVYVARIDGGHRRRVASNPNDALVPVFSPDGRRVAFEGAYDCADDGFCYERDIWIVNANGTGLRRFSKQAIAPSWTSDSKRLAYFSVAHAGLSQPGDVKIARVAGSPRPRTLVTNESAEDEVSKLLVSPHGDRVAYARTAQVGHEIRIARVDGRVLTFKGNEPSWSPDGPKIAFTSSQTPTSVYVGRPGGRRRWLAIGSSPVWSPDGRWIAFVHGSRCGQVSVIRPSGRGRRQLTHERCGTGFDIFWMPDSKRLIYQRTGY